MQLIEPLRLACGQDAPRLVEPALACLHKLVSNLQLTTLCTALPSSMQHKPNLHDLLGMSQVAHAYLQAESTPAGRLDDNTTVSQVSVHYNLQHQCTQIMLALQTKQSQDRVHAHSNLFTASLLA